MILVQLDYVLGQLDEHDCEMVAEKLRGLLARPYRMFLKEHLMKKPRQEILCRKLASYREPTVSIGRSHGLLVLQVRDERYLDWEIPEGSGYYQGSRNELYFNTPADMGYYVLAMGTSERRSAGSF